MKHSFAVAIVAVVCLKCLGQSNGLTTTRELWGAAVRGVRIGVELTNSVITAPTNVVLKVDLGNSTGKTLIVRPQDFGDAVPRVSAELKSISGENYDSTPNEFVLVGRPFMAVQSLDTNSWRIPVAISKKVPAGRYTLTIAMTGYFADDDAEIIKVSSAAIPLEVNIAHGSQLDKPKITLGTPEDGINVRIVLSNAAVSVPTNIGLIVEVDNTASNPLMYVPADFVHLIPRYTVELHGATGTRYDLSPNKVDAPDNSFFALPSGHTNHLTLPFTIPAAIPAGTYSLEVTILGYCADGQRSVKSFSSAPTRLQIK